MRSPTTTSPVAIPTRTCKGELRNGLDKIEAGTNRALSIMFMRLGIAKVSENAVTQVFGEEATVALDQFGAAAVIGGNDAS
jgi:hypothetical protein